ncbi:MAG: hypothetical protein JXM79_15940, partial [Sedimentisphaerales bacterium]|nr:hypothetical protein [Sedimentisphaerales bacterium]
MKRKWTCVQFCLPVILMIGAVPAKNRTESALRRHPSKPMKMTIVNAGTDNPTLLYGGKPMLKVGPLPEVVPFAVAWGSTVFPHRKWLDWMQEYRLGYGRVYPESGYPWVPYDADKRLIPFEIVRWEEGRPIVDLARFNNGYWQNFARVIQECADRGIILQMQLYQRVFFQTRDDVATWETNYFHPRNNVNQFPIPQGRNGYTLWNEMVEHTEWRKIHRLWIQHILDAIGDKGNVIIDLMNEGAFKNQVSKAWIEYTLDIIEDWEKRTGNDLLVGMDFDHFYKKNDLGLDYVLSHPRMELIICEGSEGHVVKDLTAGERKPIKEALVSKYRTRYRKPVISTNSPGYSVHENPDALRLYQWCSMMTKVQGAGVYAKVYPIDFNDASVKIYARQSQILMEFFASLKDYIALKPEGVRITQGPGKYRLTMASGKEIVVYLNRGLDGKNLVTDELLILRDLPLKEEDVSVMLLHPTTGKKENKI